MTFPHGKQIGRAVNKGSCVCLYVPKRQPIACCQSRFCTGQHCYAGSQDLDTALQSIRNCPTLQLKSSRSNHCSVWQGQHVGSCIQHGNGAPGDSKEAAASGRSDTGLGLPFHAKQCQESHVHIITEPLLSCSAGSSRRELGSPLDVQQAVYGDPAQSDGEYILFAIDGTWQEAKEIHKVG